MVPSTGRGMLSTLRAIHSSKGRPQRSFIPRRQLSIKPLPNTLFISNRPTALRVSRSTLPLSPILHHRFASTDSSIRDFASPTVESAAKPDDPWISTFDDVSTSGTSVVEPYIGFLRDSGIDFGYGTTSIIEWVLEHIHVYSGLPWFASIAITAILGRVLVLKPSITAADQAGRLAVIAPQTKELQAKMSEARNAGDQQAMTLHTRELKNLFAASGVKPFKTLIPLFAQIPLGFGIWRITRAMADSQLPGLETGGFSWVTDLTIPDPYFFLPIATSGLMYLTMRRGGEMGSQSAMSPTMRAFMLYGLPTASFVITCGFPASTQIAFAVSSLWALGQGYLLSSVKFRSFVNIQPLPQHASRNQHGSPYQGTITMYKQPSGNYTSQASTSGGEHQQTPGGSGSVQNAFSSLKRKIQDSQTTREERLRKREAQKYEERRRAEISRGKKK